MTNKFIEQLKPLANGTTRVPMKLHFRDLILNVISKVIMNAKGFIESAEVGEKGGGRRERERVVKSHI